MHIMNSHHTIETASVQESGEPALLSPSQVARAIGIPLPSVYWHIKRGNIAASKVFGRWVISQRWVDEHSEYLLRARNWVSRGCPTIPSSSQQRTPEGDCLCADVLPGDECTHCGQRLLWLQEVPDGHSKIPTGRDETCRDEPAVGKGVAR